MTLSIVVPAYNEEHHIATCLKAILAQGEHDDRLVEIIVVDNASTDRTAEVASAFPKVRVVHEPVRGVTRARQRGLREVETQLVGYVDADSVIDPGWLTQVFTKFESDKDLVCLSGPVYFEDIAPSKRKVTEAYSKVALLTSKVTGFMAFGSNFVARRVAMDWIGGIDTNIDFYGEDNNLARRLSEVGKVLFVDSFRVKTSARRLEEEGLVKVGAIYIINYLSEAIFKKPFSKNHKDIR